MKNPGDLFGLNRPLFLAGIRIPADLAVLVLAPHPDDFEAIGVTMRLFQKNGNRIDVAVVTSGASGVEDGFGNARTADAKGVLREYEERAGCHFFGLPVNRLRFLRLVEGDDGHPVDNPDNFERLRLCIVEVKPDIVFMPHWNDTNLGHQLTYAMFRRVAKSEKITSVVCLNQDPKTADMRNDLYMVFGAEAEAWKRRLLKYHQSQQHRNIKTRGYGFDDRILDVNRKAAEAIGRHGEFAEVFEIENYGRRREL